MLVVILASQVSARYADLGRRSDESAIVALDAPADPPGLAARYPADVGIENDPDVIFVEKFEESSLTNLFSLWTDILNGVSMSFSSDIVPGSTGARSLNIPWVGGGVNNGGHLYKQLNPGVDDTLYVRYYIKYPTGGQHSHDGIWMGGHNPPITWPNPQAGIKPVGNDRFSAAAEQNYSSMRFDHYDYWMNMHLSNDGNYWGNVLLNNPQVQGREGQWMCVEHMVKLNNPVSASNGEHAIWIDGVKVSHLGQGFPNGSWAGGNFTQNPSGSPFEGFRWRSDANLKLNWIWLQTYAPNDPAGFNGSMKYDHVVAARSYIGCLGSGVVTPAPPSNVRVVVSSTYVPVAQVTVAPATATLNTGTSQQLTATLRDASGNTLIGRTVVWSTSNPVAATVSGNGVVTALASGSTTITATSEGRSGSAAITVTVSTNLWPNEPSGMTLRTDWGLDQALPTSGDVSIPGSPGWKVVANAASGDPGGFAQLVSDPTAPRSPANVYDFVYPQNMVEGDAPATVYYANIGRSEVYAGFWWKPSAPFDYGPNGNKIAFLFNGGGGAGGQQFIILMNDGRLHVLPEYPGDYRWRTPNVNATVVTLGAWHKIEWHANVATGTLKWWLDGVLQGSYTDVRNSYNFDMFQFSPTWGGNSGYRKRQTDHYWFDHLHLSSR